MRKPSFSPEFKQESVNLVIQQGYSIREASEAVGVSPSAIRSWVKQLEQESLGITPSGAAISADQRRIQELELTLAAERDLHSTLLCNIKLLCPLELLKSATNLDRFTKYG